MNASVETKSGGIESNAIGMMNVGRRRRRWRK
jgi:hypothetical protein